MSAMDVDSELAIYAQTRRSRTTLIRTGADLDVDACPQSLSMKYVPSWLLFLLLYGRVPWTSVTFSVGCTETECERDDQDDWG
jgi:hypothetical protein